jgi:hypothetical protein
LVPNRPKNELANALMIVIVAGSLSRPTVNSRLNATGFLALSISCHMSALLFGLCEGHGTRLGARNRPLVYVDIIESAPWNWDIVPVIKVGRYRGVGMQLMGWPCDGASRLDTTDGSDFTPLSQAKEFYKQNCGMQNLGPDVAYHNLCHFELTASAARKYLKRKPCTQSTRTV